MLRSKSLVVGSTGLVGKSLVSQLTEGGQPVMALVRNDQENTNPLLEYLKIVEKVNKVNLDTTIIFCPAP